MLLRGARRRAREAGLVRHVVGDALVVHGAERISPEAQSLALAVAADPEHDIVILDLGADLPTSSWEALAAALPRRRRDVRLLVCGQHRGMAALVGQWLSERLGRTVVAPDGILVTGAGGTLFVESADGGGWVRFRRGRPPAPDGKRYPAPSWDDAATAIVASSSTGAIEPLPAGVWIRPSGAEATLARYRNRLVADVPCAEETMVVLIGCPAMPPVHPDDVIRFWRGLAPGHRARARFVRYGDVLLDEGRTFGQALADALTSEVVCLGGMPVGTAAHHELRAVRADGLLGGVPYALELAFSPGDSAGRPRVLSHRPPLEAAEEIEERVYWYAPDAVVEVVPAGLWVRPGRLAAGGAPVRSAPPDPDRIVLFYDDGVDDRAGRMRALAEDLAARLDAGARDYAHVRPASLAGSASPAGSAALAGGASPAGDAALTGAADVSTANTDVSTANTDVSTANTDVIRVDAVVSTVNADVSAANTGLIRVDAGVSAVDADPDPTVRLGLDPTVRLRLSDLLGDQVDDREWLRARLGPDFPERAGEVSAILDAHPSMPGDAEAVADAVAVRLFLREPASADGDGPLRRCVLAGLSRLPSHRGSTVYRCSPGAGEWEAYRRRRAVRDEGFVSALSAPCSAQDGDTDVVIWSLTGRRTAVLEPDGDARVEGRVVFAPGTGFKVLDLREPAAGVRGALLLRELAPNEVTADGTPVADRVSFDQLALASLRRSLSQWAEAEPKRRTGPAAMDRFRPVPG